MGKRSDFKRLERDNYATPAAAVVPLLRRLAPRTPFIEPCVGEGRLVEHLTAAGHVLVSAHDLPVDARTARYAVPSDACFISNPPYFGRPRDLHPLICNLSSQAAVTWLLLPADWLHNVSSAALMPRLRRVVSVGRVRWIEGTRFTSKDNVCWMRFSGPAHTPTIFIGRQPRELDEPLLFEAAE